MSLEHMLRMNKKYRRTRHIYDLTRKYFLLGRNRALENLGDVNHQHVTELGCGTGRNIVMMSKANPTAQFIAVDISSEMLKSCAANITKHNLNSRVTFVQASAAKFLRGAPAQSHILMSYTLSMMPDWQDVLELVAKKLSSNGVLSLVDFGDFSGLPKPLNNWAVRCLGYNDAPPLLALPQAIAKLAAADPSLAARIETDRIGFARHITLTKN